MFSAPTSCNDIGLDKLVVPPRHPVYTFSRKPNSNLPIIKNDTAIAGGSASSTIQRFKKFKNTELENLLQKHSIRLNSSNFKLENGLWEVEKYPYYFLTNSTNEKFNKVIHQLLKKGTIFVCSPFEADKFSAKAFYSNLEGFVKISGDKIPFKSVILLNEEQMELLYNNDINLRSSSLNHEMIHYKLAQYSSKNKLSSYDFSLSSVRRQNLSYSNYCSGQELLTTTRDLLFLIRKKINNRDNPLVVMETALEILVKATLLNNISSRLMGSYNAVYEIFHAQCFHELKKANLTYCQDGFVCKIYESDGKEQFEASLSICLGKTKAKKLAKSIKNNSNNLSVIRDIERELRRDRLVISQYCAFSDAILGADLSFDLLFPENTPIRFVPIAEKLCGVRGFREPTTLDFQQNFIAAGSF